jgi:hypothetical protein
MPKGRSAEIFTLGPTTPPYSGSVGVITALIQKAVQDAGYGVTAVPVSQESPPLGALPLKTASLAGLLKSSRPNLRIWTEKNLDCLQPEAQRGTRNLVFLHGLAFNASTLIQSEAIDGFCANSWYLRDALLSLLLMPSEFSGLAVSRPRPQLVGATPLVFPPLELGGAYPSAGHPIPSVVEKKLRERGGTRFGHCLRGRKIRPEAVVGVMIHLNEKSDQRHVLFISESATPLVAGILAQLGREGDFDRYFIPLPTLENREFYRLIQACDFGLCYDVAPESFGLYPLDSIFNGVPVFTNGVGNLRYLLPEGCGLYRLETAEMWLQPLDGLIDAMKPVAELILAETHGGNGRRQCEQGIEEIRSRYSYERFLRNLKGLFSALGSPQAVRRVTRRELRILPSPFVRILDEASGKVVSDYASLKLDPELFRAMKLLNGKPLGGRKPVAQAQIRHLFRMGILCARPAELGERQALIPMRP